MELFKAIAYDITENPDQWAYQEHYLMRFTVKKAIKITFFCNKPYVLLIDNVSLKPGIIDKWRLKKAGKAWLKFQYDGIANALKESLPIDKWMEKREEEIAQRKNA